MAEDLQQDQPEFLTVRELAALLRVKERKVYDLASNGAVPCSKVTGRLLFPEAEVRALLERGRLGDRPSAETGSRPEVFLGSHDPLLDWALRQSRCGLATLFDGSLDGLARFARGEGLATGLHLHDAETDSWNLTAARHAALGQNAVLVRFATRRRGIVSAHASGISGLGDLAGRSVVARQAESGTHHLFVELCARAGLSLDGIAFAATERSEADAVAAVRQGTAEATFGLETLAASHGLDFVPVVEERFDLLVDRKAWFDPPMQTFLRFVSGAVFRDHVAGITGYDSHRAGDVLWNA